jgi:hypothetical protein
LSPASLCRALGQFARMLEPALCSIQPDGIRCSGSTGTAAETAVLPRLPHARSRTWRAQTDRGSRGGHCRRVRCPARTAAAVPGASCRGRGCPLRQVIRGLRVSEGVRCPRRSDAAVRPFCADLARLTSVAEQVALLPACRPGLPRQVRGRPQCPPQPAAMSGSGRPDGCGSVRCPAALRNRGRVSGQHCPPRTLPQAASVRSYRKRSPGRRPLVGCSHRRYAQPTWRASRWRSCSRT